MTMLFGTRVINDYVKPVMNGLHIIISMFLQPTEYGNLNS